MSNYSQKQNNESSEQAEGGKITNKYSAKLKELKNLTMDIKCVRQDISLPPTTRILFSTIVSLSYKTDYCWASNKYLAQLVGVAESTLDKSMRILKSKDLIICKETIGDHGTIRHIHVNYNEILTKYFTPEELKLDDATKRKQAIKKAISKRPKNN